MSVRRPRLLPLAVGTAVVLLVAALTHFCAVLLLPRLATRDAYDLLAARSVGQGTAAAAKDGGQADAAKAAGGMRLLPPARPGDALIPLRDPAAVQGVCFFDLAKGPVRIRTGTEEGRLLTLSFRTREGRVFYSITDRAALRDTIDIRLVTAAQLAVIVAGDDEDQGLPEELRLRAPAATGLIVATALVARPSERADAEARVAAITCAPEPMPAPPPS